jgi:tripeptide aminopeptidase
MNGQRLLERFLRYVAIDTTAVDGAETYPSSQGQWELGAMLVQELQGMGVRNARQDEHGLVWATIPANTPQSTPCILLNAHLDTSPETTGRGVRPQIVHDYSGGDLPLPNDREKVIRVVDNPELKELHGCTLITTDGTTLLGGDDKAGVAVIMEVASRLQEDPDLPHGPVQILFTCDEEIGRGVEFVDMSQIDAVAAYTLDGPGANQIDVETFSADLATVTLRGVNIHPSIAKDRMVNAVRGAADFLARLPANTLSPETTDGRQGFLHPYQLSGGVAEVQIKILLRDFETGILQDLAARLRDAAKETQTARPGITVSVEVTPQYRNMREGLSREPRAVSYAEQALRRLGRTPERTIIRGGTDGSQLTARGLPTPNLSCGQHNPHAPLEWVCLEEMMQSGYLLVELLRIWGEDPDQADEHLGR